MIQLLGMMPLPETMINWGEMKEPPASRGALGYLVSGLSVKRLNRASGSQDEHQHDNSQQDAEDDKYPDPYWCTSSAGFRVKGEAAQSAPRSLCICGGIGALNLPVVCAVYQLFVSLIGIDVAECFVDDDVSSGEGRAGSYLDLVVASRSNAAPGEQRCLIYDSSADLRGDQLRSTGLTADNGGELLSGVPSAEHWFKSA